MEQLIALQHERTALDAKIDELYLAVTDGGPTYTIAEMLDVIPSSVTSRRANTLRRQRLRGQDTRASRAA